MSFLIYADDTLFQSSLIRAPQNGTNSTLEVAGSVISLKIENLKLVNLKDPLVVTFKVRERSKARIYSINTEE